MGKIKNMILCGLFAGLISIGAFIKIPMPMISFTLQSVFVIMAGLILKSKLGAVSALVYLLLGLFGVPVFTEGGGPSYVLKPSFGFIIGFVFGAYVAGKISEKIKPSVLNLFLSSLAGLLVLYIIGIIYYYLIVRFYLGEEVRLLNFLIFYMLPDFLGDSALCAVGAVLTKRLIPFLEREIA